MELDLYILALQEIPEIFAFEKQKLLTQGLSEIELSMQVWMSRYREESLNHYLALGWSFAVRPKASLGADRMEQPLLGYVLAQPLLFFNGKTQTLWVEHMSFVNQDVAGLLLESVYRNAREKHLQSVVFSSEVANVVKLDSYKSEPWPIGTVEIATTKK